MQHAVIVDVVDDDAAIRDAVSVLLHARGLVARTHASAEDFLASLSCASPICAVVDVCLPGMNGLELQREMLTRKIDAALVVMTGQASVPMAVQAMRHGAVHFIEKPLDPAALLSVLDEALARRQALVDRAARRSEVQARLERLTPREQQVLALLVEGHMNKVIAGRLGISTRTAEHHRAHIMAKLEAPTLSHLIRCAQGLQSVGAE
jgi:two-component system response regulator FixJ